MTSSVVIAAASVGLALALLGLAFTARPGASRAQTLRILNRDLAVGQQSVGPQVNGAGLIGVAKALTPMAAVRWLDRLLARAGRPSGWPLERVIVLKLVLTAVGGALGALLVASSPSPRIMLLAVAVAGLGWASPELILWGRARERQQLVQEALPDAMDQLSIAVEAGLGFEAALAHVARHSRGPLADELVRTLQDIQVGQPRRVAYSDLADRTQVRDLGRFVRALNQAEANGISIGNVLSTQAREMRLKRRQRAEEKAMKIPVKVVFPLILFIMPVLFIVIMGPAMLNVLKSLGMI